MWEVSLMSYFLFILFLHPFFCLFACSILTLLRKNPCLCCGSSPEWLRAIKFISRGICSEEGSGLFPKHSPKTWDQLSMEQAISICRGGTVTQMCVLPVKRLNETLQRLLFLNLHLSVKVVLKWVIVGKIDCNPQGLWGGFLNCTWRF